MFKYDRFIFLKVAAYSQLKFPKEKVNLRFIYTRRPWKIVDSASASAIKSHLSFDADGEELV